MNQRLKGNSFSVSLSYSMKIKHERTHVYYEKTINKFAMISRQPDIGLRQYRIALAQDRLLAPLGENYTNVD